MLSQPKRALIVEREPELQLIFAEILEPLALEVEIARDHNTGLKTALEKNFDVILCDIGPNFLKDLYFLEQYLDLGGKARVILLAGICNDVEEARVARARSSGAYAWLEKPFDVKALIETCTNAMESAH